MVLFATGMLVYLSVVIKQVTVSVAIMQLEFSGAHMRVSAAHMWMTISVAIMHVVFSAVHYAYDCFSCNYVG